MQITFLEKRMTQPTTEEQKSQPEAENKANTENNESSEKSEAETIESLQAKLEESIAKANENYDLALRTKAEAENIQRRSERDISNARKYAIEGFVNDLIPVLDSLEQGMVIEANEESKAMKEGMELTFKLMVDTLGKHGVERLDPQGKPFNPEHHEAMTTVESTEIAPDHVMDVFQKGYLLNGRIVRPARVVVARGPANPLDEKA